MSRRKQAKPQHVQSNGLCMEEECIDDGDHTSLETAPENVPGPFVCDQCWEEFSALSDLKHHQSFCSSHPKEHGTMGPTDDSLVHCMSTTTVRELEECGKTFEMEDHIPQGSPGQTKDNMAFENCSRCRRSNDSLERAYNTSGTHVSSDEQQQTDIPLSTSALAPSLPRSVSSSPPELCSWRNTSVTIENLQSTKVAVAQFSQEMKEDNSHIGTGTTTISSLLEQILALQVQQIHQLQLTNQICHQVLLFASEKMKIPESSSSKSTAPLIDLSYNLSKQLAVAAHTAQSLATQSGNIEFEKLMSTQQQSLGSESVLFHSDSLQSLRKLVTLRFQKQVSKAEYMHPGCPNPQLNDLSCTNRPSLAFGKNSLVNKTSNSLHFTQSTSQLQINCNPVINIVTSLAEQKNHKSINITFSGPKVPSNNGFFKHRCSFCAKLFGSDSALQIHVRSHTGERPYKCNICGNRFSTRGNLKVHFQRHKKRYPHVQMNPYPIPQHLDNVPTSTGIPYGMSMLPENSSTRWIHNKPCPDTMTTSSWIQSLGSTKQPSLVKQEGVSFLPSSSCSPNMVHLASNVKTTMPTDSAETAQESSVMTMNCNNEEKTSLNLMFEMTSTQEESKDHVSNDISPSCTHPDSAKAIPLLKTSDTSKLQLLLEDIDKKVSDSYECVICHRLLSCHSALRMHYRTHIMGERPYLCKLCGQAFSSKRNLRNHQAVHQAASTQRVQHSCPICQKKFTNTLTLQQHVRLHADGKTYAAPLLNQNISTPMGCNGGPLHKQHNTNESLDFSEDSGSSHFRSSLSSSLSSSVSDVSQCEEHNITSYGLSQPNWIKKEGEQDTTKERYPAYNLPTFDNLCPNSKPCHLNSEGPFQTNVSSTTLKFIEPGINPSEIELFNQIKDTPISSPGLCEKGIFKNTTCDICGKSFACQSALDIHYRTHTRERPFICTTCCRGFSTKGNLKQHILTHQMRALLPSHLFEPSHPNKTSPSDPALFSRCPLFKREATAFPHSPATSGNQRERVAPVLSWSSAAASSSLCSAVPARRMAKQHHCRTCGKTFSSSSALQIHNRTHTGEKPFACTVCLRAFTTKGNLKVHMGTHMWNSAPTGKGRRLFTKGSPVPIASSPVILPALPQKNPVTTSNLGDSVQSRSQYTDPLPPLAQDMRATDISAIQRKEMCYLYGPTGLKERPPVEDLGVTLDKLLYREQTDSHSVVVNHSNKELLTFSSQI